MLAKAKTFLIKVVRPARKAIVAALVPVVVMILKHNGIEIDNTVVETLVFGVVTSLLVWLVPNSKQVLDEEGK